MFRTSRQSEVVLSALFSGTSGGGNHYARDCPDGKGKGKSMKGSYGGLGKYPRVIGVGC